MRHKQPSSKRGGSFGGAQNDFWLIRVPGRLKSFRDHSQHRAAHRKPTGKHDPEPSGHDGASISAPRMPDSLMRLNSLNFNADERLVAETREAVEQQKARPKH